MNISVEKVHALPIIEDVLISHKPMIVKKGHTIEMDIAEDMYPIYVDKIRLKQILMNLVSNAIKFTDDEGHIIIKSYHNSARLTRNFPENMKELVLDLQLQRSSLSLWVAESTWKVHTGKAVFSG